MKITIEPDLSTSLNNFFAYPYKTFKNQNKPTECLHIPLQQRDYEWGKNGENIEGLLEDLDYHINFGFNNYFAGTVLLENQNSNFLKLIDGQQRITTLYLINFLCYLICRFRLEKMPNYPNKVEYALEFKERFDNFARYERMILITLLTNNAKTFIDQTGSNNSNQELLKRIGRCSNPEQNYWSQIEMRLAFDDPDINSNFTQTIKYSNIVENNEEIELKSSKGLYFDGLTKILEYLKDHNNKGPLKNDQYLKELFNNLRII